MPTVLASRFGDLSVQLGQLPEKKEPPPSMLHILGRNHREKAWQRLLFHFLSPHAAHGLDNSLLIEFLTAFSEREDTDFTFSSLDLQDFRIKEEVTTQRGRPDAVMWAGEEWFICWELKLYSSEGQGQANAYAEVERFDGINVEKKAFPSSGHNYTYLAPRDSPPPESDEFVKISWEWVTSVLQSFLENSQGEYPARTTAQLNDFIGTIRSELTMTDYEENQQAKAKLYLQYYDEIAEVQEAFERQWTDLTNEWGDRLVQSLEGVEIIDAANIPEGYVGIELEGENGSGDRWLFRQGISDWGRFMKDGWWMSTDDFEPIYSRPDDDHIEGVAFYHRPEQNRELAVEDHILEIQFWHSAGNSDEFREQFNTLLAQKIEETDEALPSALMNANITPSMGKPFTARYDIRANASEDFIQAYIGAMNDAFRDLVVQNPALVKCIDDAFKQAIDIHR